MIIKIVRKIVLEDEHADQPLTLKNAFAFRTFTWLCIIAAAYCVLYAGLAPRSGQIGGLAAKVFGKAFFAGLHLAYLYLVFWLLIFSQPPERLYKQRMLFPFLLMTAYVLYALSVYLIWEQNWLTVGKYLHIAAYMFFIALYGLWFFRDYFEWKMIYNHAAEKFFWWGLECLSIIVLIGGIYYAFEKQPWTVAPAWVNKDITVAGCLLLWIGRTVFVELAKRDNYMTLYRDYLLNNTIHNSNTISLPIRSASYNVLDYGCADGTRLNQILTWMGMSVGSSDYGNSEVTGFERDVNWHEAFYRNMAGMKKYTPTNLQEEVSKNINKYNLIILSHILYDLDTVDDLIRLLKKCQPNTCIVMRGAGPKSFFTAFSLAYSLRLIAPTKSHLWLSVNMVKIVNEVKLERVNTNLGTHPDAIVDQQYSLINGGVEHAAKLIQHLYGDIAGIRAKEYFGGLMRNSKQTILPNDDLIYVYKKI